MNSVGVTRQYEDLNTKLSSIPMGGKLGFGLDQYVTDKSLKGLFFLVAVEEKKYARTRPQGQRSCSRMYSEVAENSKDETQIKAIVMQVEGVEEVIFEAHGPKERHHHVNPFHNICILRRRSIFFKTGLETQLPPKDSRLRPVFPGFHDIQLQRLCRRH
jgi:hypothetical protein